MPDVACGSGSLATEQDCFLILKHLAFDHVYGRDVAIGVK